jgi:tetratricopeptide (TPR) repeat protein
VSPRPLIFVSAVSRELKSARQLVANTLTFLGYDPIWQDIFGTSEGDLRGMLRQQIGTCKGVVQLVGRCYGAEPPEPDEKFGRVSYTQYEALYAREAGKKIWYLFLDEGFPVDGCGDEPEELRALQTTYRNRLKADSHLYHPLTSIEGLEASVLKMRGDLVQLRRGVKQWALAVAVLLALGVAINFSILKWQHRTQETVAHNSEQLAATQKAVSTMSDEMAKLQKGIMQFTQIETKVRETQTQESTTVREEVYEQLSKQVNLNVALLREKMPAAAQQLKNSTVATAFERASGAYVANDYTEAEHLALTAATQARSAGQTADVIQALKLAAVSAQRHIDYSAALTHLREAETLTDQTRDPALWAEIQHGIADVLLDEGHYKDAATILETVVQTRTKVFGAEHPNTLRSRNRLAYALWRDGRYKEAEAGFRELISVEERLLKGNDPDTLWSHNGLAIVLDDEGKHTEAEAEDRQILELREKLLGPENPDTLRTRNNLALALDREERYADAEKEFRELIPDEQRILGADHPETLRSRSNLIVTLGHQNKDAEAEAGFRDLVAIEGKVLGPEHPDTLRDRNNLANALGKEGRFAEAETEFRDLIQSDEKVLGLEHPTTLRSRMGLAGVLSQQGKYSEADAQCRDVIALQEKLLGDEHPNTMSSCYRFAYQLARQGKTAEAMQFARRAANAAHEVLGDDHPDTRKYAQLVQQLSTSQ